MAARSHAGRLQRRSDERGLRPAIARGEVFTVRDHDQVVATFTLDDYADPDFWTESDDPKSALYVHRMIVSRAAAGHDLNAAILDWAEQHAAGAGRDWLRLDAWRTNLALHRYYERHGFQHIRTIGLPWRGSGALFPTPPLPPHLHPKGIGPRRTNRFTQIEALTKSTGLAGQPVNPTPPKDKGDPSK
jgi:GNAT superfamily N-acetyltransferase